MRTSGSTLVVYPLVGDVNRPDPLCSHTSSLRSIAPAVSEPSPFDQILAVLEAEGLLGDEPCDVTALECAAALRAEHLSIETMDEYVTLVEQDHAELKELAIAVMDARARLEADELVPEAEVETVVDELEATTVALEQANRDRRSTVDDLRDVDRELTSAASELEVITGQLDERTAEVERLNDFVQGIVAAVERPMIVVDRDMVVRAWNEPASDLLQTTVKDAVGKPVGRLAPWLKAGPVADALVGTLDGGQAEVGSPLRPAGHPEVGVRITAINAADGSTVGAIIIVEQLDQR